MAALSRLRLRSGIMHGARRGAVGAVSRARAGDRVAGRRLLEVVSAVDAFRHLSVSQLCRILNWDVRDEVRVLVRSGVLMSGRVPAHDDCDYEMEVVAVRANGEEAAAFLRDVRRLDGGAVDALDGRASGFRVPGRAVHHDLLAAEAVLTLGQRHGEVDRIVGERAARWKLTGSEEQPVYAVMDGAVVRDDGVPVFLEVIGTAKGAKVRRKAMRWCMLAARFEVPVIVLFGPKSAGAYRDGQRLARLVQEAVWERVATDGARAQELARRGVGFAWWDQWYAPDGTVMPAGYAGSSLTVRGRRDAFGPSRSEVSPGRTLPMHAPGCYSGGCGG